MAFCDKKTGEEIRPFGYKLDKDGKPVRDKSIDLNTNDYGCDPLGEDADGVFRWRMVPSGDIVSAEERTRKLNRKR